MENTQVQPLDQGPDIETISLERYGHDSRERGVCAMELVAWLANEPHSDHPACTCPVLADVVRLWNDRLDDEPRQRLKSYLPRLIGTAGDGAETRRAWMVIDWAIREALPSLCDVLKLNVNADGLRALAEVQDEGALNGARTKIAEAIEAARSFSASIYGGALARARALARALARAVDLALARDRGVDDRARVLARAVDLDLALARFLDLDLAFDLALARALDGKKAGLIEESVFGLIDRLIDAPKPA